MENIRKLIGEIMELEDIDVVHIASLVVLAKEASKELPKLNTETYHITTLKHGKIRHGDNQNAISTRMESNRGDRILKMLTYAINNDVDLIVCQREVD